MPDTLMAVYERLPPAAQSIAASLRGLYLRHWRSGPGYERQFDECLERDGWSIDRWKSWQDEHVAKLLYRAATKVPFYRMQWEERRRRGDRASMELLENWPLLEKDSVRATPRAFLADDRPADRQFHERTSGTTGTPIDVWRSRETLTSLYAMAHARTLGWLGISERARYARLGGQLIVPPSRRRPPFWVWNAPMHQLYMSTFHLSKEFLPHYIEALKRYRIEHIAGYPSAVTSLAHAVLERGAPLPMRAVFTNAEGVDTRQREAIQAAFGCEVFETYGQAEMVAAASECPAGRLHQWPEAGYIEVLGHNGPAARGEAGEVIATGLLNVDMPLIRYRIGDRLKLGSTTEQCTCGRSLPLVDGIEGRAHDLIRTPDGRSIFWLNPVFYGLPIRESQIVQDRLDHLEVTLAPADGYVAERDGEEIVSRLRDRLGDMSVTLRCVDRVPRTASGKLRPMISRIGDGNGNGAGDRNGDGNANGAAVA